MNKEKLIFLIGSPDISGGSYVIFNHALFAFKHGYEIYMVTEEKFDLKRLDWFEDAKKLNWITYQEATEIEFNIAIATWWRTIYELSRIKAKNYMYFVQSIETLFYPEHEKPLRKLVDATYTLPLNIITEANWIKEYLENEFNRNVLLARNGIDKNFFNNTDEAMSPRKPDLFRVLIEGPIDVAFKNVVKTIKLCKQAQVDEIWLLTSSPINKYAGVDKVFSKIPINKVGSIYRSCDVIVKLSYVEGMFGPPLEMFHCGGTSITYNVTGHDEYIINGTNGIVINKDDDQKVVEILKKLKNDNLLLTKLKVNALKTASQWIDWSQASQKFIEQVNCFCEMNNKCTREELKILTKFYFNFYEIAERYRLELGGKDVDKLRFIKDQLRIKSPFIFSILKKIKLFFFSPKV